MNIRKRLLALNLALLLLISLSVQVFAADLILGKTTTYTMEGTEENTPVYTFTPTEEGVYNVRATLPSGVEHTIDVKYYTTCYDWEATNVGLHIRTYDDERTNYYDDWLRYLDGYIYLKKDKTYEFSLFGVSSTVAGQYSLCINKVRNASLNSTNIRYAGEPVLYTYIPEKTARYEDEDSWIHFNCVSDDPNEAFVIEYVDPYAFVGYYAEWCNRLTASISLIYFDSSNSPGNEMIAKFANEGEAMYFLVHEPYKKDGNGSNSSGTINFKVPEDEWSFSNFSSKEGIPLTFFDEESLLNGLSSSEKEFYKNEIENGAGGLCYGFAATSVLANQNYLDPNTIENNCNNLSDVPRSIDAKSAIGYYYLQQFTAQEHDHETEIRSLSETDRLEKIRNITTPILLCFDMESSAHAMVGYKVESGEWSYFGHTYNTRLKTYDSNAPAAKSSTSKIEGSYLYFNRGTNQWEIPNYHDLGANSYSGYGNIRCVWDDYEAINAMDLSTKRLDYYATLDLAGRMKLSLTQISLIKAGRVVKRFLKNSLKDDDIFGRFFYSYLPGEENNTPYLLRIKEYDEYRLDSGSSEDKLNLSMLAGDYCYKAKSDSYDSVILGKTGSLELSGLNGGYSVSMTDNHAEFDWDTLEFSSAEGTEVSMQKVENGILIEGDGIDKGIIKATSDDGYSEEKPINTNQDSVLVSERSDHIVILEDRNHDGTYESEAEKRIAFEDVKPDAYYYEPVLWAVNHVPQITNGTSETTFSPKDECLRCQIVTFLWRAMGCPEPTSTENPFVDVKPTHYFYKAVLWAVEQGITNGMDATHFSPNLTCTRGQAVTFLWRAEGKPAPKTQTSEFTDVQNTDAYFYTPVLWAVENNITNGTGDGKFSPNMICLREQIVTFLYRDLK